MRLRFGYACNQDLNFKTLSRHLLIPMLQAESLQTTRLKLSFRHMTSPMFLPPAVEMPALQM